MVRVEKRSSKGRQEGQTTISKWRHQVRHFRTARSRNADVPIGVDGALKDLNAPVLLLCSASSMERVVLCVRTSEEKRTRLAEYAREYELIVNDVLNCLIDQLLVQVDPDFETPGYLEGRVRKATRSTGTGQ